ncbi:MAG: flagellar hook-associated protein FlgL, partial [Chromatiales bacterium]|nr:flagellar hook-associated protein FlgL [Chromatiales bacterium]
RLPTKTVLRLGLNSCRQHMAYVAPILRLVGSGRRLATAADDPAGAAQALLLQQGLDRLQNYAANAETARRRLSLSEDALSGVTDTLNRLRELAVQAGGGVQSPEARTAIASESRELIESLLSLANSQDGEGRSLFAGNRVQEAAFVRSGEVFVYNGDDGTRSQRIGDNRTLQENEAGSRVFGEIPAGNGSFTLAGDAGNQGTAFWSQADVNRGAWTPDTYTLTFIDPENWQVTDSGGSVIATGSFGSGDSISFAGATLRLEGEPAAGDSFTIAAAGQTDLFSLAQSFMELMESAPGQPSSRARFQEGLNASLQGFDQALSHIGTIRSQIGGRLGVLDEQLESNSELALQLSQTLSTIRDLDYAEAVSDLERQLFGLEAAQKTFARTRSFSLFDIL